MILKSEIMKGLEADIIKIVDSPHGDGSVCKIGDNWFYFDSEADDRSADEYLDGVTKKDLAENIYWALCDMGRDGCFDDELRYYEALLKEALPENDTEHREEAEPILTSARERSVMENFRKLSPASKELLAEIAKTFVREI